MADFQLTTPVAFLVFNRPETTARVFAEIRRARPRQLLLVADGPRAQHPSDAERCAAVRRILEGVDWPCEVQKNFSEHNLGCKRRMSSGVDWVFQTVPEAILLEDDCVPHPSFFRYCQELLEKYRQEEKVAMIGGVNFQFGRTRGDASYYFSRYSHIWGWASWRRAWQKTYDVGMQSWPEFRDGGGLEKIFTERGAVNYWRKIFDATYEGKINTWDYQWMYANLSHGALAITPQVNLITNIGAGSGATHTVQSGGRLADMPAEAMAFPLRHPQSITRDLAADTYVQNTCFRPTLGEKIVGKLNKLWNSFTKPAP